ncbi:uncharacterized protein LOC115734382 isoform X1 [Rhodamnia argentea]|uniref:Uncharacterized protein LOC115734382 isoform X1 n=1 Tax=Rhodamnia argentea TaxID=178133 RepID=A0ABM3HJG4_9MYRT|nr:uncharacterized protein LOC115734382 isoform X1 [Rhodamnia argentea]
MAGIACIARPSPITLRSMKARRAGCCRSIKSTGEEGSTGATPKLIKLAVSGVTEILRVLSPMKDDSLESASDDEKDGVSASSVDDVVMILTADYEKAYFVTGTFTSFLLLCMLTVNKQNHLRVFTSAIYAEDCIFEDPTIRFRGKGLYERNLKLLVPFFDHPSIILHNIQKGDDETYILARWKLRTYLKLPWRPLISIDGKTVYELDDNFVIVRHAESWNVSALEAIGQIFTPSFGRPND